MRAAASLTFCTAGSSNPIKIAINLPANAKQQNLIDQQKQIINNLEYDIARANRLKLIGLQLIPNSVNLIKQKSMEEKINELIKKELEKKEKDKNDSEIMEKITKLLKLKSLNINNKKSSKKKSSKKKSKKKSSKKKSKKKSSKKNH